MTLGELARRMPPAELMLWIAQDRLDERASRRNPDGSARPIIGAGEP